MTWTKKTWTDNTGPPWIEAAELNRHEDAIDLLITAGFVSAESLGISPSNTAAQNRTALLALEAGTQNIVFKPGDYNVDNAAGQLSAISYGGNVVQYYSYNLGNWHIVALDSNIARDASSPQVTWLKNDLAQDTHPCEVAYFHHPLFSSGEHGNDTSQRAIWDALYAAGVDVVINGHDHDYERFALQRPDGTLDTSRGIREFVVGTGGRSLRPFGTIKANSQVRNASTFGVPSRPTSSLRTRLSIAGLLN
jgi:Calcineurin-like phosphoesterase